MDVEEEPSSEAFQVVRAEGTLADLLREDRMKLDGTQTGDEVSCARRCKQRIDRTAADFRMVVLREGTRVEEVGRHSAFVAFGHKIGDERAGDLREDVTGFFQGGNISRGQLIPAIGEEIRVDQARRSGAADRFRHLDAYLNVLRELETTERPQDSFLKNRAD